MVHCSGSPCLAPPVGHMIIMWSSHAPFYWRHLLMTAPILLKVWPCPVMVSLQQLLSSKIRVLVIILRCSCLYYIWSFSPNYDFAYKMKKFRSQLHLVRLCVGEELKTLLRERGEIPYMCIGKSSCKVFTCKSKRCLQKNFCHSTAV